MVDSVLGNAATGPARQAVQLSNGRDRAEGTSVRVEQTKAADIRPADGRAADVGRAGTKPAGLVSEARNAVRAMSAEPPVDAARVADLRAAISSGSYRIDADRIADSMLRSETGTSGR